MIAYRLLTASAAAFLVAAAGGAWGQTPSQTAKTQARAEAATGKATTDAPAASQPQGAAAAIAQGVTGAVPAAVRIAPTGDIVQTLQAAGQFTTLIKALNATNLTGVLKANTNLTLFAPTDAAFAAYAPTDKLLADLPGLQKLLMHHLINAPIDSSKFRDAYGPVKSVAGDDVVLNGTDGLLKADNANLLQADVRPSNGVIHVVDQVLKAGSVPAAAPADAAAPESAPAKAKPAPENSAKGTKRGGKS